MNKEERASRAIRLREIMADGEMKAVFQSVIDQHTEKWITSTNPIERERHWQTVNAVKLVQQEIATLSSEITK